VTDDLIRAFAACVVVTLAGLDDLQSLLAQEREALLGSNPTDLKAIITRKVEALTRIEKSLRQTDQLLIEAGYETGIEGGDQLLRACAHSSELAADWQALQDSSQKIARMNSVNGHLVSQARASNRAALSTITGRIEDQGAYDKRGQGQSRLPGYKLGEA
jgi:flagellar biosynthesis/type III secretory pathway chaperone